VIDEFSGAGQCDLMSGFAAPLPVLGKCEAVGIAASVICAPLITRR
jgi:hypothetical protein